MTTTVSELPEALPEDLARKLEAIASERGLTPVEVVRRHFQPSDPAAPEPGPQEAAEGSQPWRTPQSLDELGPRQPAPPGMTAMEYIAGKWPGDETDQELLTSLREADAISKPNHEELTAELKAWRTPQSLDELKPRVPPPPGMTAMQFIEGKWPGDETEEELLAMLKAMG